MTFAGLLVVRKDEAGCIEPGFKACLQPAQARKVQCEGTICHPGVWLNLRQPCYDGRLDAVALRIFRAACDNQRKAMRAIDEMCVGQARVATA
jgi:hypothetical protein